MTSFFVVSGFGIPWVLYHADLITPAATILSLFGGVLIYGTVMGYLWCFKMDNDSLAI